VGLTTGEVERTVTMAVCGPGRSPAVDIVTLPVVGVLAPCSAAVSQFVDVPVSNCHCSVPASVTGRFCSVPTENVRVRGGAPISTSPKLSGTGVTTSESMSRTVTVTGICTARVDTGVAARTVTLAW